MARMLYNPPNFLVLDEPTNHLDLATKEMLVEALKDFEGTMIFVSHDRTFLRGLGSRVLELGGESGTDRQPRVYPGSYVEYVQSHGPRSARHLLLIVVPCRTLRTKAHAAGWLWRHARARPNRHTGRLYNGIANPCPLFSVCGLNISTRSLPPGENTSKGTVKSETSPILEKSIETPKKRSLVVVTDAVSLKIPWENVPSALPAHLGLSAAASNCHRRATESIGHYSIAAGPLFRAASH